MKTIDDEGLSNKWEKCKFLTHEIEWLDFKINNLGTKPMSRKADAITNLKESKCIRH